MCYALLCCAVLCCAVLCCAVLCCAVLCCAVLGCAVLCCAVLPNLFFVFDVVLSKNLQFDKIFFFSRKKIANLIAVRRSRECMQCWLVMVMIRVAEALQE